MTIMDIIEQQNAIIKMQSDLIKDLFGAVSQHAEVDALEAKLKEIERAKEKLNAV